MAHELQDTEAESTVIDWALFKAQRNQKNAGTVAEPEHFSGKDKRQAPRWVLEKQVNVRLACGVVVECRMKDISTNGVWFDSCNALPVGQTVCVEIPSPESGAGKSLKLSGEVARVREGGFAVAFSTMDTEQKVMLELMLHDLK